MPAYNAEKTLEKTYNEIPHDIVDEIILVDDKSSDSTVEKAKELNISEIIIHQENKGYGGNQKTCYDKALEKGADIVIMLHPDYQYTPSLIRAMASVIVETDFDLVLASRILGNGALKGGMPLYKYISNRFLTFVENIIIDNKLSEYHSGYRAYSRKVLTTIPYRKNSDDFIFDNEFLVQAHYFGFKMAEISCPAKYFPEASSINFLRSLKYGLLCCITAIKYFLQKHGIFKFELFQK